MRGHGDRGALLERNAELDRLARTLDAAAAGRGSSIQIEGPAGIGKTGLLEAARAIAQDRGMRSFVCRAGELERDFAYGVVRRLFERHLGEIDGAERRRVLAGSAALAAPAIGLERRSRALDDEASAAVVHGLYWLAANLATELPLFIAVDDVHWSDTASLRFLAHLATRVDELPIALLMTARPREPGPDDGLVDRLATTPGVAMIRPAPLSVSATGRVVADRLDREVAPTFADACHAATRGNPFLVGELAGALEADGSGTGDEDAARVRDLAPDAVTRTLLFRLARMPAAVAELAKAVAVLGEDADLHVASELAGIGERAAEAVDALVSADVLAPEVPLNFVHPIVRSAIYSDLGPGARARAHAEAAELLLASGASDDRVATHVLRSAPAGREHFVDVLRAAADAATARGVADVAVGYLRRALAESGAAARDGRLLYELGRAEHVWGRDPEAAAKHVRAAIPLIDDPERRADAWGALSRTTMAFVGVPEAVEVLDAALTDLTDLDAETRLRLEVERNCLGITHAASFARSAERIDRLAGIEGETVAERLALCNLAYRSGIDGTDLPRTVALCRRALGDGSLIESEGTASNAINQALYVWWFADGLAETRPQTEIALERARERGSPWGIASAWGMRAADRYFAGDIAGCEADARQAVEVPGFPPFAAFVCGVLAWALIERGDLAGAEDALALGWPGPDLPPIVHTEVLLYVRGLLRAAQGRDAEALADLLDYGARSERVGAHNPGIPWRAQAALACARLADGERALELVAEHRRRAEAWGARSVVGIALRAQGVVVAGEEGLELLREAVAELERSPARLEHARALVDLGAAVRRAGARQEARPILRDGLEIARGCAATALVERAHSELVVAGARPRRLMFSGVEALTASERRVAAMAAEGLTNREIAQDLFVTVKTVENHLSRIYGKLGIHSRSDLARSLAGDG